MKKLNAIKWKLSGILSLLLLSGCTPTPPDVFVFEVLTPHVSKNPVTGHTELKPSPACMKAIGEAQCCHAVYIVSKKEMFIGDATEHWYNKKKSCTQLQNESVHVPAQESWGPLSEYVINSCERNHCNDQVDRFKIVLPSIDGLLNGGKH